MNKKRIFIAHGDLITDYIYQAPLNNKQAILIDKKGGGSKWNVLHHLANMGETCYAIGSRGNDEDGRLAEQSLREVGVDTSSIIIENKATNVSNLIYRHDVNGNVSYIDTNYSPITNLCTVDFSTNLPINIPNSIDSETDIFTILSNIKPVNLEFLNNIQNKKCCLDIGALGTINEFDSEYIWSFLHQVNLLLLNGDVTKALLEKLGSKNITELFTSLNLDLLIETKGVKPVTFMYNKDGKPIQRVKTPNVIQNPIDPVGAGDSFFSVIVRVYSRYVSKQKYIDEVFIDNAFVLANNLAKKVVQTKGCRLDRKAMEEWVSEIFIEQQHKEERK